ncbi:hypothetical protein Rhe02_94650 [Rhizocola hellebori]|uniref:Uncharacterized protein n=1 Tax=Rhizocola hellebori TaxID=1392758 RepID=A0A8J3VMS1_9ACTN|nr:hypothetical protein [Rhizocola hellebori]GIH11398.1 hypothetical protein Rhe02_94650 [Rhizocola hellebori]
MTELIPQNAYPAPAVATTPPCAYCGCAPTINTTIRGHRGIIIVMQFLSQKGPFCRDCGIATFRAMSSKTMIQGWWGYASFIITPFILLWNLIQRVRLGKLSPPAPAPDGNSGTPMAIGRPVLLRAGAIGLVVPLAVIGVIGSALLFGPPADHIGQCVVGKEGQEVKYVSCDKPNDGKVISVATDPDLCPAEATGYVEQFVTRRGSETKLDEVLCLK